MKRLNVKLLVYVLVGSLVLVVGVAGLHAVQVKRNSGTLLLQAQNAQKDGKLTDARRLYKQYLSLAPDDDKTYSSLAMVSVDVAAAPEATPLDRATAEQDLDRAAVKDPDNMEVRRKLADAQIRTGMMPRVGPAIWRSGPPIHRGDPTSAIRTAAQSGRHGRAGQIGRLQGSRGQA